MEHLHKFAVYYEMRPLINSWFRRRSGELVLIRTTRSYTHTTPMSFLAFLAEVAERHRRIAWSSPNPPETIVEVARSCMGEEGVLDLTPKIRIEKCTRKLAELLQAAWYRILEWTLRVNNVQRRNRKRDWVDANIALYLDERHIPGVTAAARLWTLAEYTIFLRRFRLLGFKGLHGLGTEDMVFDLYAALQSLRGSTGTRQDGALDWLSLQACCYSGIMVYPLLVWYSTSFGAELPPATIRAYSPGVVVTREGSRLETPVAREESYGYMGPDSLARYSQMLKFDSSLIAVAIDIFYSMFFANPWIRASVHSSFLRTLGKIVGGGLPGEGENASLTVLPAFHPAGVMHERALFIPEPIVVRRLLTTQIRNQLGDQLQRLARRYASPAELRSAARIAMNSIREEIRREETNIVEALRFSLGKDKKCILGVIVEVLHPTVLYLEDYVAEFSVAHAPGPSININLIHLIINRLAEAEYLDTLIYYVVDAERLYEDARRAYAKTRGEDNTFERQQHAISLPGGRRISSQNLERLAKAIMLMELIEESRVASEDYECIQEITNANRIVFSLTR